MGVERLPVKPPQAAAATMPDDGMLSPQRIAAVARDIKALEEAHEKLLDRGPDYDKLPGTNNLCLYQPGAQKLAKLYNLGAEYEFLERVEEDTFISFTVRCLLRSRAPERLIGSALGSCNSREEKYRWRWESTGEPIPKTYWKAKGKAAKTKILGRGFVARKDKDTGEWTKHKRVPNDSPWDLHNTVLKMAQKRAFVRAVLETTAASHLFVTEETAEKLRRMREDEEQNTARYDPERDGPMPEYDAQADRGRPRKMESGGGYAPPAPPPNPELDKLRAECRTLYEQLRGYNVDLKKEGLVPKPPDEMTIEEMAETRALLEARLREEEARARADLQPEEKK